MRQKILWTFLIFLVFAIITFFFFRSQEPSEYTTAVRHSKTSQKGLLQTFDKHQKTDTVLEKEVPDVWDVWIEAETEALLAFALSNFYKDFPSAQELEPSQIENMRASFRTQIAKWAAELKSERTSPPPVSSDFKATQVYRAPERYTGPQTVEGIMEKFDGGYSRHHTDTVADAKYPRNEWLAMLQDKGITIEKNQDYWRYLQIREDLARLENDPDAWESGWHGISPTSDWETYKSAYMERKIWETQQIQQAQKADPKIISGIFGGPNRKKFLPIRHNTLYVKREGPKASFQGATFREKTQEFNLIFRGIEPEGYDIIYLDSNDNILSEPPPPITREELLNAERALPPEGWWDGDFSQQPSIDFQTNLPTQETTENRSGDISLSPPDAQQNVQEQIEQAQRNMEKILERLDKSDAEILSELEKQLTPEIPSEEDFQTALRQRFSPERFNTAMQTLNRYGPEEGLRRLKASDPEVAKYIERNTDSPE